ncbi:MAG: putative nucleotidyltransferase substrate binding domain-containing protein, partial [Acidimicrobiales bacterium]
GRDHLEEVGRGLADMADAVLVHAFDLAAAAGAGAGSRSRAPAPAPAEPPPGLAVVAMGKLGARELNYASDIDLLFVAADGGDGVAGVGPATALCRSILEVAGRCFRVDVGLRPEGRNGPLVRSLASYRAYWERWGKAWERQALLKARPVAGDRDLGAAFAEAAEAAVWGRRFGAAEIREARDMKARAEAELAKRGLTDREVKRGRGGIRDVEFSVQLLQLVHGRADPDLRQAATLPALAELARAGYVSGADAGALERSYRFLRTVEHRLQMVEERQVHAVPTDPEARTRLARVLGYRDDAGATALGHFDEGLRRHQGEARRVHERLFFRPLLEAFAILPAAPRGGHQPGTPPSDDLPGTPPGDLPGTRPGAEGAPVSPTMTMEAVSDRLGAFGFTDATRTRAALAELTRGLTRSSRLMAQMLALVLGWLSEEPDPDLGLLGLRTLADGSHRRALLVSTFRDSPEAARRLCRLLGTSRPLHDLLRREPELIATLSDDASLGRPTRSEMVERATAALTWRGDHDPTHRLFQLKQSQLLRIAARDLLGLDTAEATGAALSELAEAVLEAAVVALGPPVPLAIVAMGRLGGAELSYASDLDLLVVIGGDGAGSDSHEQGGEETAERLLRLLHGPTPADRVFAVDPDLRPEGKQGRLARTLGGYRIYYERWAKTWERQALVRARPVAGDPGLGQAFMDLVEEFVWHRPFTDEDLREIRRMKARVERERMPPGEDPQFHLKLGPGALADVEWTAQLLQLAHKVRSPGTTAAVEALRGAGAIDRAETDALVEAYRCCERVRNRWALMGGAPRDALPVPADQLGRLAHSLGTTATDLRQDYRRVTRRARRVVERRFYGIGDRG